MTSTEGKNVLEAAPLVEVWRGPILESRHRGHIAVVDGRGRDIAFLGSPQVVTYLRSASKPQQAVPLVTTGAADCFGFSERELAIACGSHNGDPEHIETVRSMLRKIGLDESSLRCGPHEPYGPEASKQLRERGEKPSPLHNNCSGKHAGMLAVARHIGAPLETYDQPDNPVQVEVARVIAKFADLQAGDIPTGLDGCGVPCFAVSVREMALMFARLTNPPAEWDAETVGTCLRLVQAMQAFPEMVGGRTESQDTALMKATGGRMIAKAGAEGVFTGAILPGERWPDGVAVALKIEDGDPARRARRPTVIEMLRQLDVLSQENLRELAPYGNSINRNHRGDKVGEVRAAFQLQWVEE
jgi:L-asparaginase II